MMYDGAVTRDRAYTTTVGYDEALVPRMYGIAKSIRWEGDSTLVFEFEEGVEFHDGTPFNAEAALFGYRRMWDPTFEYYFPAAGAARADIGSLVADNGAAMETLGEYTLAITLKQRSWDFLDWMSMMGQYVFPSPAAVKEFGNESIGSNPVGTGPFKFVEWEPNVRLVLEANDDYWQGRPFLDEIIMVPIPDAGARMAAILSGEVDMAHGVRAEWVNQLQDDPDITLHVRGRAEVLNMRPSYFIEDNPLNDEALRVALNMAIDREGLANVVLGGTAYPAGTFSSPSASTYDPSANVVVPYDLDEAARLLAEAGYPGGEGLPVLNMLLPSTGCGTDTVAISEYVQSTWSEIGVELNLEVLEFNSMLGRWFTGGTNEANADTHLNILCHGLDSPFRIKMEYSIEKWTPNGWNASHYYNPETEAWLDKMSAARNYSDYISFAQKAEAVATAETSDFWTVHAAKPLAVHKKIKGWKPAREWSDLYTKLWIEE
jgi:peptide/nickel transport system substrate-binding protein